MNSMVKPDNSTQFHIIMVWNPEGWEKEKSMFRKMGVIISAGLVVLMVACAKGGSNCH